MTADHAVSAHIRRGPRWEAVGTAISAAEGALAPAAPSGPDDGPLAPRADPRDVDPSDDGLEDGDERWDGDLRDDELEHDEELEDGWGDEARADLLDAVRHARDELAGGVETAAVLAGWRAVDVDELDIEEPTVEGDAVLELDLALSDLERAESALAQATKLEALLAEEISATDRDDGFDEPVRDELVGLLGEIRVVLSSGELLGIELLDSWADALRALGYLRAVERPGVDDDATAVGFTRQRIEQFPPGRRFEPVAIFDGWLYNIGFTDTLDDPEVVAPDDVGPGALSED